MLQSRSVNLKSPLLQVLNISLQGRLNTCLVVVGGVDVSGHPEVTDLHHQVGPHQAVPRGQVPVDVVLKRGEGEGGG